MNKETYEALKRVMEGTKHNTDIEMEDFKQVETWIEEVAKEYEKGVNDYKDEMKEKDDF